MTRIGAIKRKSRALGVSGFTLVELMMVITIISMLALIALPKFASLIRKSKEGSTKGNLGALRAALLIYYADMEGQYPAAIPGLADKFIGSIPQAKVPFYHPDSAQTTTGTSDAGGWAYGSVPTAANYGVLVVNCTHTDTKGKSWTSY